MFHYIQLLKLYLFFTLLIYDGPIKLCEGSQMFFYIEFIKYFEEVKRAIINSFILNI